MIKANVFDAKARFSELLDHALTGEPVIICRHNRPVAELRAIEAVRAEPRPIGPLPGRPTFDVPPSFFEPMPDDELVLWEGGAGRVSSPYTSAREATRSLARERPPSGPARRRVRRRRS